MTAGPPGGYGGPVFKKQLVLCTKMPQEAAEKGADMTKKHMIISIGRECGCGGHEIGEKIAEHYGLKLYDSNLVEILAKRYDLDQEKLMALEERVTGHLLPARQNGFAKQYGSLMNAFTKSDRLFMMERNLIRELAQKESFVIVGRAANAILADNPDVLRVYVYASQELLRKIRNVDKVRRNYFNYYSDKVWASSDAHDFMIDTSLLGIDDTVDVILGIADRKFNSKVVSITKTA